MTFSTFDEKIATLTVLLERNVVMFKQLARHANSVAEDEGTLDTYEIRRFMVSNAVSTGSRLVLNAIKSTNGDEVKLRRALSVALTNALKDNDTHIKTVQVIHTAIEHLNANE